MSLPLSYSLRNLKRRPWRAIMTVSGVALVVFASILILSLSRGLSQRISATGEEENILVISNKGQTIMFSAIEEKEIVLLGTLPGVAKGANGEFLVSPEILHGSFVEVENPDNPTGAWLRAPLTVRGVKPIGYDVHRSVRVVEGHAPEGPFEILAGRAAHVKMGMPPEVFAPGRTIRFENRNWEIVGTFEANGSMIESELWMDEGDLQVVLRRKTHSFAVARFENAKAVTVALGQFHESGPVEGVFKAWSEQGYYESFGASIAWVFYLSLFMVVAIAVAGALAGVNTMYTAIINRMGEIATLRVLGFKRRHILASLTVESLAQALCGGAIGAAAGHFVNDIPMKMAQGAFFLVADVPVLCAGLALSAMIGLIGAFLPSWKGLRLSIVEGFRYK